MYMNHLNSILIEGIIIDNPEFITTKAKKIILKFLIASYRYYHKNNEVVKESSFFEVNGYKQLTPDLYKKLIKNTPVRIVGYIKQDRWIDSEDGRCEKIKIICEEISIKK